MVVLILEVLLTISALLKRNLKKTILNNLDSLSFGALLGVLPLFLIPLGFQGEMLFQRIFVIAFFISLAILFLNEKKEKKSLNNLFLFLYLVSMGAVLYGVYIQNTVTGIIVFLVFFSIVYGLLVKREIWNDLNGNRFLTYLFALGPIMGMLIGFLILETITSMFNIVLGFFTAGLILKISSDLLVFKRSGNHLYLLVGALVVLGFYLFGV